MPRIVATEEPTDDACAHRNVVARRERRSIEQCFRVEVPKGLDDPIERRLAFGRRPPSDEHHAVVARVHEKMLR